MGLDTETVRSFVDHDYARVVNVVAFVCGDRGRAEDAVQDALVRAWATRRRIDVLAAWVTAVAYPPGASYDVNSLTHDGPVVVAFTDGACTGCAASRMCGVFDVATTVMGPCQRAVTGETHTQRDEHTVDFVDPSGVEGVRVPRGAGTTASGAAIWFPDGPTASWLVTCALGPNVDPRCRPITDDFVARHRTSS
jgi:hypothetical protein